MHDIVFAGDFTPSQHALIAREFAHHSVDQVIGDSACAKR
jgi:hypothetical protein